MYVCYFANGITLNMFILNITPEANIMNTLRACNQISYPSHNTKALSYKIFEHLALQVGSSNSLHKTQIHSILSGAIFEWSGSELFMNSVGGSYM
jgi:hypothetical protein